MLLILSAFLWKQKICNCTLSEECELKAVHSNNIWLEFLTIQKCFIALYSSDGVQRTRKNIWRKIKAQKENEENKNRRWIHKAEDFIFFFFFFFVFVPQFRMECVVVVLGLHDIGEKIVLCPRVWPIARHSAAECLFLCLKLRIIQCDYARNSHTFVHTAIFRWHKRIYQQSCH